MNEKIYDVVICGGGLAGSTLARQLKLTMPELSVVVLDKDAYPLPEAAFKVGESSVYDGAYYFGQILQLEEYFEREHLPKLGLRYFYGNTKGELHKRPEFGISDFPPKPGSYQIDRGKLENDLRLFNKEMGIEVLENCLVKDIDISENREEPHQIVYIQQDSKEYKTISARWVVDAMGRRRYIQKKLGLAKPNDPKFNAAWFRVKGRVDISDFVPSTEKEWHDRVPNNNRYYSTNHLCGRGYWVWLIPLATNHTSLGIVASEEFQPFSEFHTQELAFEWLERNEPVVADNLKGREVIDFKKMPRYSYSSTKVFSINRWGCVGEAAVFADPLYSPGSDLISYANTLQTHMIRLDREGKLTEEMVEEASNFYIGQNDGLSESIHNNYSYTDHGVVMGMKNIWNIAVGSSFVSPLVFNPDFLDPGKTPKTYVGVDHPAIQLDKRMEALLLEWRAKSLRRLDFGFLDYWKGLPFLMEIRQRNLKSNTTEQELIDDRIPNLDDCEALAISIFLLAVEDTMPEMLSKFPKSMWVNAWAMGLDPKKWESEGLFEPKTQPRDFSHIREPLRKCVQVKEPMLALAR